MLLSDKMTLQYGIQKHLSGHCYVLVGRGCDKAYVVHVYIVER